MVERGIEIIDIDNFTPRNDHSIAIRFFSDLSVNKEAAFSYELTKSLITHLDKINDEKKIKPPPIIPYPPYLICGERKNHIKIDSIIPK